MIWFHYPGIIWAKLLLYCYNLNAGKRRGGVAVAGLSKLQIREELGQRRIGPGVLGIRPPDPAKASRQKSTPPSPRSAASACASTSAAMRSTKCGCWPRSTTATSSHFKLACSILIRTTCICSWSMRRRATSLCLSSRPGLARSAFRSTLFGMFCCNLPMVTLRLCSPRVFACQ